MFNIIQPAPKQIRYLEGSKEARNIRWLVFTWNVSRSSLCLLVLFLLMQATEVLRALVSTTSGARGWFVSLLTNQDFEPVFVSPIDESFLSALCESPGPNAKLMTMNVAMSTATELVHEANGNSDLAAGSRMTSRRSAALIAELIDRMDGLRESIEALYSAVDEEQGGDKEWIEFCKKWGCTCSSSPCPSDNFLDAPNSLITCFCFASL